MRSAATTKSEKPRTIPAVRSPAACLFRNCVTSCTGFNPAFSASVAAGTDATVSEVSLQD